MICEEVRVQPGTFETRRFESCVYTHGHRTGHLPFRSLFWVVPQGRLGLLLTF
jgi:hypothetical protein